MSIIICSIKVIMDLKRQMYRDNGFVRKFSVLLRAYPKSVVTYDEFHNRHYAQPERVLRYYGPIVTFQNALLTFRIGSKNVAS
jgi:hypothetical protein